MRLFKKLPRDMFQILNGVGSLEPDLIERHLNKMADILQTRISVNKNGLMSDIISLQYVPWGSKWR